MDKFKMAEVFLVAQIMDIYDDANYDEVKKAVREKLRQDFQDICDSLKAKE